MRETAGTRGGFTLIELLVVVALLGLLMAVVPPMVSRGFPTVEMRGSARQLAAGLRQVRSEAVLRGTDRALFVDLEKRRYQIGGDVQAHPLPGWLHIELITAQSEAVDSEHGAIRFYPDGSSTGGRVTLRDEDNGYVVDVDWLTGRIDVRATAYR